MNFFYKKLFRKIVWLVVLASVAAPSMVAPALAQEAANNAPYYLQRPAEDGGFQVNTGADPGSNIAGTASQFDGLQSTVACTKSPSTWPRDCLVLGIAWILQIGIRIAGFFLGVANSVFNVVLQVQNTKFYDQVMVNRGWEISRDVVNMFYILFLLIISISTIVGFSSYGIKQLLWKVIISALFVNFSLTIGSVIVDMTNALGNTFYVHMGEVRNGSVDVASTFTAAFGPQRIYQPTTESKTATDLFKRVLMIIIAYIMGIILILVATFVLGAGAIFLITRIIYIWILLILSPFAFLFWVLPRTESISNKWFETLFNQAFFYPAYMFMLYLALMMVRTDVIAGMLTQANDQTLVASLKAFEGNTFMTSSISLIIGFIAIGAMLVAALMVAKNMGAVGASAAMATGKKMSKSAQGYVGNVANRPASWASRKFLDSKAAATMARIPLVRQGLKAPLASVRKADSDIKKSAAGFKDLPAKAAAAFLASRGTLARTKAAAYDSMDAKKKQAVLRAMSKDEQLSVAGSVHATNPAKEYKKEMAKLIGDVETGVEMVYGKKKPAFGSTLSERNKYQELTDEYTQDLKEKDVANINEDSIRNNSEFQRSMFNYFSGKDIQRMAQKPENAKALRDVFKLWGNNQEEMVESLKGINLRLAKFVKSAPGKTVVIDGKRSTGRDLQMGEVKLADGGGSSGEGEKK